VPDAAGIGSNGEPAGEALLPAGNYFVARSSPAGLRTPDRGRALGDHPGRIAGNIHGRNPDIRSRLPSLPDGTHPACPRVNVAHIGQEQAGNTRSYGDRGLARRVDDHDTAR